MSSSKDDKAKMEQIIGECFVKTTNIILSSRIYQSSKTLRSPQPPKRSWFNLEVEEISSAQEEVQQLRRLQAGPLVLQICQNQGETSSSGSGGGLGSEGGGTGPRSVVEVWSISWEQDKRSARSQSSRMEPAAIYKRLVILLRSLFVHVRILPAYKLHKASKRQGSDLSKLSHILQRGVQPPGTPPAVPTPGKHRMQQFKFTPIETPYGSFKIEVLYQHASDLTVSKQQSTSVSASPNIINDYVGGQRPSPPRSSLSASLHGATGSEFAAHPSQPSHGTTGGPSTAATAASPVPQPGSSPILRRHSWSLSTARSESGEGVPHQNPHPPQPGTTPPGPPPYTRSSSMGSGVPASQVYTRSSKAFAPGSGSAATPPKYPSGGLASRMSQAAMSAASKLYSGQTGRGMMAAAHPFSRVATPTPASREPASRAGSSTGGSHEEGRSTGSARASSGGVGLERNVTNDGSHAQGDRLASKPVGIPGGQRDSRRLHSSEDLRKLGADGQPPQPSSQKAVPCRVTAASAPAAQVYFGFSPKVQFGGGPVPAGGGGASKAPAGAPQPSPFSRVPSSGTAAEPAGTAEKVVPPQGPPPPVLHHLPSLGSESDSSVSSSFPASCSPQLPFAFTPSNHSYNSMSDPQRRESGLRAASPPHPDAILPPLRRPSWGSKTSSYELSLQYPPSTVGYSVSPVLDSLGSSLFSSSTPKTGHLPHLHPSQASSPMNHPSSSGSRSMEGSTAGGVGVRAGGFAAPRLTSPGENPSSAAGGEAEAEADLLPFAIDREPSVTSPTRPSFLQEELGMDALTESDPTMSGLETEADVAVGAFVRLIQDAPSLHQGSASHHQGGTPGRPSSASSSHAMTLQAGLDQLARLRMQLSQMQGGDPPSKGL